MLQGGLLTFFNAQGGIGRYLLFWLILERTAGAIVQMRDHLEHYGMWGRTGGYQLTQLYSCRNLDTYPWVGWLMGGLDYHADHHAFPDIPFVGVASPVENRLPAAFVGGSGAFALAIASPLGESHSGSFTTAQFATDDSG